MSPFVLEPYHTITNIGRFERPITNGEMSCLSQKEINILHNYVQNLKTSFDNIQNILNAGRERMAQIQKGIDEQAKRTKQELKLARKQHKHV